MVTICTDDVHRLYYLSSLLLDIAYTGGEKNKKETTTATSKFKGGGGAAKERDSRIQCL